MSTIWRKVLADFRGNKTRTFLMILTITLGVFALGFMGNTQAIMNRDMQADFSSANPPEARVYIYPITDDWVRALGKVDGVRSVEGRTQLMAQLVQDSGSKISIQFNALKSLSGVTVGILKPANPADGLMPVLQRRDVAFDRSAGSLGFQPGQTINVELADGHARQLYFKGYVHDVSAYPYIFTGYVTAYVTPETAEWMEGPSPDHYNQLLISVADNPTNYAHVLSVAQAVADRFKKSDMLGAQVSVNANPGRHFAWQILQSAMLIMTTLGWMTVLLSAFLIVNTIMALMSQHIRQIGIMKAIGGGVWQIFGMYLILLLVFSGIALAISIPLSAWVSYQLSAFMADFLNYQLGSFYIDPNTILLQCALAVIVPLVAALAPLVNSVRIPVREALNNYGIGNGGGAAPGARDSRLEIIPRPVLISIRNAFRRKLRVSLTLCALVLGGAIFVAVCNHWLALDQSMRDVQGYFLADINFTFTNPQPLDELRSITAKEPGVQAVEGWMSAGATMESADGGSSDRVRFIAPPSDSVLIHPILTDGRWLNPLDMNAIVIGNQLLLIRPDLKVGDWVTIKLKNEKKTWQIIGVYRMPGNTSPRSSRGTFPLPASSKGRSGSHSRRARQTCWLISCSLWRY